MKLTSNWNGKIYWRTFNPGDTIYRVGLAEGTLQRGSVDIDAHGQSQLKIEIRRDRLQGTHIVKPGALWSTNNALILNDQSN